MEVTGGVIGAVALGIQLVDIVQKVMAFINSIQDAPEDLASLGSSVGQLKIILHRVTTLVESWDQRTDIPGSVDLLEGAVRNCEPNVTKLGKLVDKLQMRSDQSGKRRAAWASLRFVMRKEDLDRYRSLIQGDLMALNTAIAFSAYEMNLQQVAVARTHRSLDGASITERSGMPLHSDLTIAHDKEEQVQDIYPTSTSMVRGRKRGRRNVIRTTSRARIYHGFFGYIYVKKKTTHLSGKQEGTTPISEEVEYFLHSSFLRVALETHQARKGGMLSRSLRYCPILPDDSEIFEICYSGDLERFRQALNRQEVPIHAQRWNGITLFHMACYSRSLELCSLLMELGVDASHEDIYGVKAVDIFSNSSYLLNDHSVEAMVRLMIRGQEHVEEDDVSRFLEYYSGPPIGVECVLSLDVHPTKLDWRRLPIPYLTWAVRMFADDVPQWTNLVRKMVRQADDLHCLHVDTRYAGVESVTLLDHLLIATSDPIEGAQVSKAWLEILAVEGLDVREYLKVEMELHEDNSTPWYPSKKKDTLERFLFFDIGQKPKVEWDWGANPEDPASLVCDEFRHMALRYDNSSGIDGWMQTWPFIVPEWACYLGLTSIDPATTRMWRHMEDLADSRAAHRVSKKEVKAARAEGNYLRKRMPGSWID